jgi:hypothetical protein
MIVIYANGYSAKSAQCIQKQFKSFTIVPKSFCDQNAKICAAIRSDDYDTKDSAGVVFDGLAKESADKMLISIGCSSCGDAWAGCGWNSPEIKAAYDQMLSTFKFINAQTAVSKTEIITYQPHRDGVTQYKTINGDCSGGSTAANRADAYRCITSSEISDPCFVLPNEKLLICGVDIVTGNGGFLLQPAKTLPKGELWKNNIQGWAMRLQLISGEICSFMGGATGVNAKNERLNYQCGDAKNLSMVIYGDLVADDVWTANVSDIERNAAGKGWNVVSTRTVGIAKLWQ